MLIEFTDTVNLPCNVTNHYKNNTSTELKCSYEAVAVEQLDNMEIKIEVHPLPPQLDYWRIEDGKKIRQTQIVFMHSFAFFWSKKRHKWLFFFSG